MAPAAPPRPAARGRRYPIGIPALYFALLHRHRKRINPDLAPLPGETAADLQRRKVEARDADASIHHLAFLYETERKSCP